MADQQQLSNPMEIQGSSAATSLHLDKTVKLEAKQEQSPEGPSSSACTVAGASFDQFPAYRSLFAPSATNSAQMLLKRSVEAMEKVKEWRFGYSQRGERERGSREKNERERDRMKGK